MSRVLKPAGQTVISVIQSLSLQDTEAFRDALGKMGLKIMDSYSGNATSGKHFNTQILTLEKIGEGILDTQMLVDEIGSPGLRAFKFKKGRNSAGNPRKILKDFSIENKQLPVSLNSNDSNVLAEEERLTQSMESLKQQYKTIETIPKEEIHQRGFSRIFNGKRYILFKQLSEGHGAVVVR